MKNINKILGILTMVVALGSIVSSCKKEDSAGQPVINYVRVTNPASSDSLLVGAAQGKLIAIMGDNLGGAVQMWFNDQEAKLNPSYITNTTIIVNVPAQIPLTVDNKLKIKFKDGQELSYNFKVQISKPVVSSMVSEFVNSGDVATIRGNYFYAPLTVTFTGGATGTIESIKDQAIDVRVPAGAQPGPITVKTNFGETKSDFCIGLRGSV